MGRGGQAVQRSIIQKFKTGIRSLALHNSEKTAHLSDCSSRFPRGLISHLYLVLLMNNLNSEIKPMPLTGNMALLLVLQGNFSFNTLASSVRDVHDPEIPNLKIIKVHVG